VLFTEKVFQLYDMIKCRHGLMIVGPANSGKSAVHTSLRKALNYVVVEEPSFEEIETESYVINPKSVTIEQLYGSYEPISQEF
jgi:dynein heavy chain